MTWAGKACKAPKYVSHSIHCVCTYHILSVLQGENGTDGITGDMGGPGELGDGGPTGDPVC